MRRGKTRPALTRNLARPRECLGHGGELCGSRKVHQDVCRRPSLHSVKGHSISVAGINDGADAQDLDGRRFP